MVYGIWCFYDGGWVTADRDLGSDLKTWDDARGSGGRGAFSGEYFDLEVSIFDIDSANMN